MPSFWISGGRLLLNGEFRETTVLIADGAIHEIGGPSRDGATPIDAGKLLVFPGIVDIHGDAFERQVQPRPGVEFPMDLALAETERQLLSNGVTTAFHGVTLSWEPGLRSAETWRLMLDALGSRAWSCDTRVHMRWEAFNVAALDMAIADIEAGRVHLLAFNDHTPSIVKALSDPAKATKFSGRGPLDLAAFTALAERVAARSSEVPDALDRIAAAARAAKIPMASHDDDSVARRDYFRAKGATICEFPMAEDVGVAAREGGDAVAMGSPNVVRGGSHLGWASAARLAEAGICDVLTSDYFYPCLLHAPFALAARGVFSLAQAWDFVSLNAARAAGLADRGSLEVGRRADVIIVDASGAAPEVAATFADGRLVYLGSRAAEMLRGH